jgi:PKD repeat protein
MLDAAGASEVIEALQGDFVQVAAGTAAGEAAETTPPANLQFAPIAPLNENQVAELLLTFSDADIQDAHTVEVDWGDGSVESFNLSVGSRFFATTHRYLDDDPSDTSVDVYEVGVRITDSMEQSVEGSTSVTVHNVMPSNLQLGPLAATQEHGFVELGLTFDDPGSRDEHTVEVDWGDGSVESFNLSVGSRFFATTHQYLDDNPTGTSVDDYAVQVRVLDDDGGMVSGSTTATVRNVAPGALVIAPITPIDEHGVAELGLTFTDPGTRDEHRVEVDWGDGTVESFTLSVGSRLFATTHQYLDDNPTGTSVDDYAVQVRVLDDDGGMVSGSTTATVRNVAPGDLVIVPSATTIDEGGDVELEATFADQGTLDTHSYRIDWGDGVSDAGTVVDYAFGETHTYADNGVYTVTVTVVDDDLGEARRTVQITVLNVDPTLRGADLVAPVDEGQAITLAGLGVGLIDPGFDNPFNIQDPTNGGETQETFVGLVVDWGDGTTPDALGVVDRVSGSPGVLTTAEFLHDAHVYADNGTYTITVRMADDDGGTVARTFTLEVRNVAPTLVLTRTVYEIDEGETLVLPDLGTFSDPGFDNPLNTADPSNDGEVTETFFYTIDWGDDTPPESGQLPIERVSGQPGVLTVGSLANSHFYADNDRDGTRDNRYTVTVTLFDDDEGQHTQSIEVIVYNVNPTLKPVAATDLNTKAETFLTLEFSDPGADTFEILVDWGDQLNVPNLDDRFVIETLHAGPTPQTFTLRHVYAGPPDPLHPAADIVIRAKIRDDDFPFAATDEVMGVIEPGESNVERVAIKNPGEGVNPVRIDTTPLVPRLDFTVRVSDLFVPTVATSNEEASAGGEIRGSAGESKAASEKFLELRIIYPDGSQSPGIRLKSQALDDLDGLIRDLPDNRYAIYLVQPETNQRRLVLEVFVRGGRLVDPGDESEGTRDRPPVDEPAEIPAEEPLLPPTSRQEPSPPLRWQGVWTPALAALAVASRRAAPETPAWRAVDPEVWAQFSAERLRRLRCPSHLRRRQLKNRKTN